MNQPLTQSVALASAVLLSSTICFAESSRPPIFNNKVKIERTILQTSAAVYAPNLSLDEMNRLIIEKRNHAKKTVLTISADVRDKRLKKLIDRRVVLRSQEKTLVGLIQSVTIPGESDRAFMQIQLLETPAFHPPQGSTWVMR